MYHTRSKTNLHQPGSNPIHKKRLQSICLLKLLTPLTLAGSVVVGGGSSAQAVTFNFTYAPGTSLDHMIGFEMAGLIWSEHLKDDVTVNLFAEMIDRFPEKNIAGGAIPGVLANYKYDDFLKRLKNNIDVNSLYDQTAFESLKNNETGSKYQIAADGYEIKENNQLHLTRANAKALGIETSHDSKSLDGIVLLNKFRHQPIKWNLNFLNNQVPEKTLDFLSVITHEIGHNLGFISMVDGSEWQEDIFQAREQTKIDRGTKINRGKPKQNKLYEGLSKKYAAYTFDLFRYSSESTTWDNKDTWIDLSIGGNKFFSVNGKNNAQNNCALEGGDSFQGSHWKQQDKNVLGIMDPLIGFGERRDILRCDTMVFDAIGYELNHQEKASLLDQNYRQNLYNRAVQKLADRIGTDARWLLNNSDLAAALISPSWIDTNGDNYDDRGDLINKMLFGSEVYKWGFGRYWQEWGTDGYWWGFGRYWQEHSRNKDSLFQTISWQKIDMPTSLKPQSVPEPCYNLGLLGLVLLGIYKLPLLSRFKSLRVCPLINFLNQKQ